MKYLVSLFLLFCCFSSTEASVKAIAGDGTSALGISAPRFDFRSPAQRCSAIGYNVTCSSGYKGVKPCPYDNNYFKDCCPEPYTHTINECVQLGLIPSNETCLNLHACE